MRERPSMASLGMVDDFRFKDDDRDPYEGPPDDVPGVHRYWGKYRGVVKVPIDPENRGRLMVSVENVWGPNVSSWALPCLPYGGLSMGMFVVPQVGANVWVEFQHGNPELPIWTGFWWGSAVDSPKTPLSMIPGTPNLTVESFVKHAFVISDTPVLPWLPNGGLLIKSLTSWIAIDATGIRMFGLPPGGVQVNGTPAGDPLSAALHVI